MFENKSNLLNKFSGFFYYFIALLFCYSTIFPVNADTYSCYNPHLSIHDAGINIQQDPLKAYSQTKQSISSIKQQLKQKNIPVDSVSIVFTDLLINRIIPYWYGTTWSFEGHTSIPQKGEIACGYFVSTTLKDAGLNLNRYKLAQQSPENEGRILNLGMPSVIVSGNTSAECIDALCHLLQDGIHFIGFDQTHVGFIVKQQNSLFLIHSDYVSNMVKIEKIEESAAFSYFNRFYITELSGNKALLEKWLDNEEIKTVY